MELKIFITYNCNLNCEYCFVIHDRKMTMDEAILEKILEWAIFSDKEPKKIVLTGGEPTSRFGLIVKAAEYVLKNDAKGKIKFDFVPTNGSLLTEDKIKIAKSLNLKFAFSLDGYTFEANRYRFKHRPLYDKIMENISLYIGLTGTVPRIKMTVSPRNAGNFYENVRSLLIGGLTDIQVLPAFGTIWKDKNKKDFLADFDKLLKLHRYLKKRKADISVDPIDWYVSMIRESNYGTITHNNCDMGEQVSFDPRGRAYACLGMIHLSGNDALKNKYSIGSIDKGVDLGKMRSFKDYLICLDDTKISCKYCFPNISCKKVCSTIDFKTGSKISARYRRNLNEIENEMFHRVNNFYFGK